MLAPLVQRVRYECVSVSSFDCRACLDYLARHFKEVTTSRSISAEPYASPYTHRHASTHLPHANTQQEPGLGPEQDSSEHSGAVGAVAAVAACEPPMRSFSAPAAQHGAMAAAGGQCTSQTALSQAARKDSEPHNGLHPAHSAGSAGSGGSGDGGGSGRCSMDVQGVWDAEFAHLPTSILCDLLLENTIPVTEKQIFDAVVWWATGGDVTLQQQQGQGAAVLDATVLDLLPGAVDVASAQGESKTRHAYTAMLHGADSCILSYLLLQCTQVAPVQ